MFEIIIDGKKVQVLQPVNGIKSLVINHHRGIPIPIQTGMAKPVAGWLYTLTQEVEFVEYNKILIPSHEVNKPAHLA